MEMTQIKKKVEFLDAGKFWINKFIYLSCNFFAISRILVLNFLIKFDPTIEFDWKFDY
jgi:hypothetical protein